MPKERANRAQQFLPFASLRGYYDLVRKVERVPSEKHIATEEEVWEISQILGSLSKGDIVKVLYYDTDSYVEIHGAVSEVVSAYRYLRVIKTKIAFDDILKIQIDEA